MITPTIWTLNVRGLDWLNAEANLWFGKMAAATGQDKADAKAYLDAVIAERNQRDAQYAGGFVSTALGGVTGVFETLGGSSGAGAAGLAGGVADMTTATLRTASAAAGVLGNTALIAAGAAALVAFLYLRGR